MTTPLPRRPRGPKPTKVDPDHLLDAAQKVFLQEGLRAASLRAIARAAGCDPALIYYHFESKEALFLALLDRRLPPLRRDLERLAGAADQPASERLWAALCCFHGHVGRDPGIRAMIRGEIVRGAEDLAIPIEACVRPMFQALRKVFEQGKAQGELRADLDPVLAPFFLVRMQMEIMDLVPTVLPRLAGPDQASPVEVGMRTWFELFWRGVAADPSAPLPPLPGPAEAQP